MNKKKGGETYAGVEPTSLRKVISIFFLKKKGERGIKNHVDINDNRQVVPLFRTRRRPHIQHQTIYLLYQPFSLIEIKLKNHLQTQPPPSSAQAHTSHPNSSRRPEAVDPR